MQHFAGSRLASLAGRTVFDRPDGRRGLVGIGIGSRYLERRVAVYTGQLNLQPESCHASHKFL
jgi:hypothetical protein